MIAAQAHVAPALLLYRHLLDQAQRDAIVGYRNGGPTAISQDAHAWITRRGREGARITFDTCCHWLNLNSEQYRQVLLKQIWQARLELQANPAAVRARFKAYGRQVHQVHR